MNAPESEPEPKPKRSRRMIVWLVVAPIVVLLLALTGANWKAFHLAYAKHLMRSDDPEAQERGVWMVIDTHLRDGMTLEEVRRVFAPAKVSKVLSVPADLRERGDPFTVATGESGENFHKLLLFNENDRLVYPTEIQRPRPGATKRK